MPYKRHARSSASRGHSRRHARPSRGLGGTRHSQQLGDARNPVPDQLWVDLEFTSSTLLATGAGLAVRYFALNDPLLCDGVNAAAYFNEIGQLYSEYLCTSSKIQLTLQCVDPAGGGPAGAGVVVGLWPAPVDGSNSVTTPATVDDVRAFPQAKWTALDDYSKGLGSLHHATSIKKYTGIDPNGNPDLYGAASGVQGGVPTSPATVFGWVFAGYPPVSGAASQGDVNVLVKITYKVRFTQPVRAATYKVVDFDTKSEKPLGPAYAARIPTQLEWLQHERDAKAIMSRGPECEDEDDGELLTVPGPAGSPQPPSAAASPPSAAASPPTAAAPPQYARTVYPRVRA